MVNKKCDASTKLFALTLWTETEITECAFQITFLLTYCCGITFVRLIDMSKTLANLEDLAAGTVFTV